MSCLNRLPALVLLMSAALLAACAPTTELLRSSDEQPAARPARSLVVVGVSTDDALRRRYEQAFVHELAAAGITGIASSDLVPTLNGLSMQDIRERMHTYADRADAALHVQLVGLVQQPTWSPQDLPADSAPASGRIGGVDIRLNAPAGGDVRGSVYHVDLEANLYALPARTLLWTVLTRTREANDPAQVARSHARALIAAMRERGYVASP
ncbi:MAG: hypothetical protein ACOY3X_07025 [Pseudomonadota bacterium]